MKEGWKRGLALFGLMMVYGAQKMFPDYGPIYDWLIPILLAFGGIGMLHAKFTRK